MTYASQDSNQVYALVKAIDESEELWINGDALMVDWSIDKASVPPAGAPFHEGAIRYFREKGLWTPEKEEWNNKFIERMGKLQEAWN